MFEEVHNGNEDTLIISDEHFMGGNPIVKGTHITVEQILLALARGISVANLLDEYPQLTKDGITAALKFAAESVHFDHVTPQDSSRSSSKQDDSAH